MHDGESSHLLRSLILRERVLGGLSRKEPRRQRHPYRVLSRTRRPGRTENWSVDRDRDPAEFNRLVTLSDGVFAIALTLLVLSLDVPAGLSQRDFIDELVNLTPMLIAFAISVGIIAIFWFSHHEVFSELQKLDTRLVGLTIAFLSLVVLIPFVQRLQGDYPFEPIAYVLYASVLATLNFVDGLLRVYSYRAGLLRTTWSPGKYRKERTRSLVLTGVFLISAPLALVLVNWTVIIWLIVLPLDQYLAKRPQS
jgi:uncharacterized membrane protein